MGDVINEPSIELNPPPGYGWKYLRSDSYASGATPERTPNSGAYVYVPVDERPRVMTINSKLTASATSVGAEKPTITVRTEVHDG